MITVLALALVGASPAVQPAALRTADPPVKLWLSSNSEFVNGDGAHVHVRAEQDGYIVVLRADAGGRLRMLFPVDPGADNFVRAHMKREIRGRGDREAFVVDDREGEGLVLAAWSASPFHFNDYTRGDHWDYAALDTMQTGPDKEAGLLSVVQDMAGTAHFDFDAVPYSVGSGSGYYNSPYAASCWGCGVGAVGFGWGWGWPGFRLGWGAAYCSPYWGFGCSDFYGLGIYAWNPFFFGYGRPYLGFGPWYGRGFGFGYAWGRPGIAPYGVASGNLFINRVRGSSPVAGRTPYLAARAPLSGTSSYARYRALMSRATIGSGGSTRYSRGSYGGYGMARSTRSRSGSGSSDGMRAARTGGGMRASGGMRGGRSGGGGGRR